MIAKIHMKLLEKMENDERGKQKDSRYANVGL